MSYEEITHAAFSRVARQAERQELKAHHVSREAVSIVMAVRAYVQEVRTRTCLVKPGWREAMRRAARVEETSSMNGNCGRNVSGVVQSPSASQE